MAQINVPSISTGKVVKTMVTFYKRMIDAGIPFSTVRPIMLFGPTGVGKSSSVYETAEELEAQTGRKVHVIDIRLTTASITDLSGIPYADANKEKTVWLKPEIYMPDADDKGDDIYIIFFDELEKATPGVQAAALQMILDRKAWVHKFPPNTFVIAAANPARGTNKYETRLSPELMNRFKHYNVQPDFDSFREWGIKENIHPYILGYLSYDESKLYADSESEAIAFPTPRSWKSLSDLLNAYENEYDSVEELHFDIAGEIGTGAALEFEAWCVVYQYLPVTENVFKGIENNYPKTPDVLYALISSMTVYVTRKKTEISNDELRNACVYADRFPADFRTLYYKNLSDIEGIELKLMKVPEYLAWVEESGKKKRM